MKTERSAGILVFRMEAGSPLILLLHYDAGHWDFPKGKLEDGESDEQAARRELEEETGITQIELVPEWKRTLQYFYTRDGQKIFKNVAFFLGQTSSQQVTLSDEHQGFLWLSPELAEQKVTFDNAKHLIQEATSVWKK